MLYVPDKVGRPFSGPTNPRKKTLKCTKNRNWPRRKAPCITLHYVLGSITSLMATLHCLLLFYSIWLVRSALYCVLFCYDDFDLDSIFLYSDTGADLKESIKTISVFVQRTWSIFRPRFADFRVRLSNCVSLLLRFMLFVYI